MWWSIIEGYWGGMNDKLTYCAASHRIIAIHSLLQYFCVHNAVSSTLVHFLKC